MLSNYFGAQGADLWYYHDHIVNRVDEFDVKLNRMAARTFSIPRSPENTSVSLYLDSLTFKERNVEEEKITDDGS